MGAYAVPSDKPFIVPADKLKRKRKRGQLDEMMEFFEGTTLITNEVGELVLMRGDEIVGVFEDEDQRMESQ